MQLRKIIVYNMSHSKIKPGMFNAFTLEYENFIYTKLKLVCKFIKYKYALQINLISMLRINKCT